MKIKNSFSKLKSKFAAKIKSKKIKALILTCTSLIGVSIIVTFISIFATQSNGSRVTANNYVNSNGMQLDLSKDISNQKDNLNVLVNSVYDKVNQSYDFYFSEDKIKSYIFKIVDNALYSNGDFSDSPTDYTKTIRYQLINNQKQVIFNLFLYNKSVKSKKFISNFKLSII